MRAAQKQTQRRIQAKKQQLTEAQRLQQVDAAEREKHNQLIGQLKAAEARNRLRIMRTTFLGSVETLEWGSAEQGATSYR